MKDLTAYGIAGIIRNECIHPDDQKKVFDSFKGDEKKLDIEFRLRQSVGADYKWVNLTGSVMKDENGDYNRVVACVHNIQQHKMLEEAQKNKQIMDSTTKFYRLEQRDHFHAGDERSFRTFCIRDRPVYETESEIRSGIWRPAS